MLVRTVINLSVTEERRAPDNSFIKYRLACETEPFSWGMFQGYKTIEELGRAVKVETARHCISDIHRKYDLYYYITSFDKNLVLSKKEEKKLIEEGKLKEEDRVKYARTSDSKLRELESMLRTGIYSHASILSA